MKVASFAGKAVFFKRTNSIQQLDKICKRSLHFSLERFQHFRSINNLYTPSYADKQNPGSFWSQTLLLNYCLGLTGLRGKKSARTFFIRKVKLASHPVVYACVVTVCLWLCVCVCVCVCVLLDLGRTIILNLIPPTFKLFRPKFYICSVMFHWWLLVRNKNLGKSNLISVLCYK